MPRCCHARYCDCDLFLWLFLNMTSTKFFAAAQHADAHVDKHKHLLPSVVVHLFVPIAFCCMMVLLRLLA